MCEGVGIGALGQVLTNESIGVLVEPTLPGMVGVGEAALGVESLGDGLMVGELLAVVIGARIQLVSATPYESETIGFSTKYKTTVMISI